METQPNPPFAILAGRYYSNGSYGRPWGVRQVLVITRDADSGEEVVDFKGVAGTCRRKRGRCGLAEFRSWARYEVALNENSWQRVGEAQEPPAEQAGSAAE